MASSFRIFDIDADPDIGNFSPAQIKQLQNGGQNKVLSYFNLGSCESFRSYWNKVPAGFVSCAANKPAQLGRYAGYANEVWMNVANTDYQHLIVNHVAPRLVAQGIDGFYFDNLEIVEHGTRTNNGPCDAACSQGGLNLIARLRDKYPGLLFVMQNATSDKTRLGKATGASGTVDYPSLLDGIAHEEVFKPALDKTAEVGTGEVVGHEPQAGRAPVLDRHARLRGQLRQHQGRPGRIPVEPGAWLLALGVRRQRGAANRLLLALELVRRPKAPHCPFTSTHHQHRRRGAVVPGIALHRCGGDFAGGRHNRADSGRRCGAEASRHTGTWRQIAYTL